MKRITWFDGYELDFAVILFKQSPLNCTEEEYQAEFDRVLKDDEAIFMYNYDAARECARGILSQSDTYVYAEICCNMYDTDTNECVDSMVVFSMCTDDVDDEEIDLGTKKATILN